MSPAVPTWLINETAFRRRIGRLPRIGPRPLADLFAAILAERPGADIIDMKRPRLTLPAAVRQARAA